MECIEITQTKILRIYFATDVHGSEIVFRKFLRAADFYNADVLILGGDITGKQVVPITENPDGTYSVEWMQQNWKLQSQEELEKIRTRICDSGLYLYNMSPGEDITDERAGRIFNQLISERLERFDELAEKYLRNSQVKCYITGGNDDPFIVEKILGHCDHFIWPEGKVVDIGGYEMISTGYCNQTPWNTPRELKEEELRKKIETMVMELKDVQNSIWNIHVPPKDSGLDVCPKLDTSVYPPRPSVSETTSGGSQAVRELVEKHQPLIGLHGHIHESRGCVKMGKTLLINSGSEYGEGILRGAIINLARDKKRILSYQLVSG